MISRLTLKNFTVFKEADFEFAPGLNVIVGENGTGKSHILKVAYAVLDVLAPGRHQDGAFHTDKRLLETPIASKLVGVFGADKISELVRSVKDTNLADIAVQFDETTGQVAFRIFKKTNALRMMGEQTSWVRPQPVFLPTRELLSIYPGFVSLYATKDVSFEETWRDTCLLLGSPRLRGESLEKVKSLWNAVEQDLGGEVHFLNDRFSLLTKAALISAPLMAEGQRKLAMVAQLIANGSLSAGHTMFWDEPEANLNSKVIKQVARTILQLCRSGVQTVVATHSLFLMRELDILLRTREFLGLATRFIGLRPGRGTVTIDQGGTVDDIGKIAALQEELTQSDRYLKLGID